MKKVGIITFHNSYNCGSMLETYAIHQFFNKNGIKNEIINFSSKKQKEIYNTWFKNNSIKNIIKNIIIFPYYKKIEENNKKYVEFQKKYFSLSRIYKEGKAIDVEDYEIVVAGSDQIWNITIDDYDDAYFLPWKKGPRKVAYSPSFGARNIIKYSKDHEKFKDYICDFDALSIRERNGKKWIKELTGKNVPVLLDPTLLLEQKDYDKLIATDIHQNEKYIFFYSPGFDTNICKYVKKIAKKYKLKVITWSRKSYHLNFVKRFGFELAKYENPSSYLNYIKNAELVITTSYHGTIFSTIYKKKFITVKNGNMYGDDDRVITLLEQLNMMDRLIPYEFDANFNYLDEIDYSEYEKKLNNLKIESKKYLRENVGDYYNEASK